MGKLFLLSLLRQKMKIKYGIGDMLETRMREEIFHMIKYMLMNNMQKITQCGSLTKEMCQMY